MDSLVIEHWRGRGEGLVQSTFIKEHAMNKTLAIMIAAFAATGGAYAQNPAGASSQEQVITNSKPQQRAQAKDNAKKHGGDKKIGGDEINSAENDNIGTGKAAAAGQAKSNARMAKNPKDNAGQYPAPPNTPGMPAAK